LGIACETMDRFTHRFNEVSPQKFLVSRATMAASFADDDMALQGNIEVSNLDALDTLDEPVKDTIVTFYKIQKNI
jgi:hypothetical protein